ncbi:YccF domain-containing protein [Cyanobacterium aponinum FACHB-4101]|uniref:YccF domain-containing protein n=1 Tax=Cyanobacterium aponinum TaxID=379064 RepID=UPI0016817F10|nr:YccF domain-containing protein [Cyanobacterium aponinum]MBD2393327.1 YccF domain-containing protein [Cyanobacterium aponinum FACHB-4101]
MTLLGNIIWLIFGGFVSGLGYIIGGLSLCLTIIGIPFGLQTIKIGIATLTPFGKINVVAEDSSSLLTMIFNVIWVILFGWEIALSHLVHGLILAITIIGIPFAQQHFKLIPIALFPFGRNLQDVN